MSAHPSSLHCTCLEGTLIGSDALQLTAGKAFTHRLWSVKRPEHKLVTWGIYRHLRHPAYLGWFLWSVGTQLLLCNLVCLVGFVLVVRCPSQCAAACINALHHTRTQSGAIAQGRCTMPFPSLSQQGICSSSAHSHTRAANTCEHRDVFHVVCHAFMLAAMHKLCVTRRLSDDHVQKNTRSLAAPPALQVVRFFRRRVPEEERRLVEMFGVAYAAYAARTPIWIPTVEGASKLCHVSSLVHVCGMAWVRIRTCQWGAARICGELKQI